jgi:WD40 repeat protein
VRHADASTLARVAAQSTNGLQVNTIGFSPDGRRLALGTYTNGIQLLGGRPVTCTRMWTCWLRRCGWRLKCGRVAWLADATTLALVVEQTLAYSSAVYSIGFSPDGTKVVSGSFDSFIGGFSIRVWGGRTIALSGRVCSCACTCAPRRYIDTGTVSGAGECSQRIREFCGLLARRHEARVGL